MGTMGGFRVKSKALDGICLLINLLTSYRIFHRNIDL